jgi:hypothetical protein
MPKPDQDGIEFPATIPAIETAVKVHGEGGARMQLDVAESDLGRFLPALVMRGKRLLVRLREDRS